MRKTPCLLKTRALALTALIAIATLSACEKAGGSGTSAAQVSIPAVAFTCTTPNCKVSSSGVRIIAQYSTSSCASVGFGAQISASVENFSCTTSGCSGQITSSWLDQSGDSVTTIAAGSYTICVRADMNADYPNTTTGDALGELTSFAVSTSGGTPSVTTFTDQ